MLHDKITVLLSPSDDDDDDDEEALHRPALRVTLDVGVSAFANARSYYGQTKAAAAKTSKTLEAAEHAVQTAEKKAMSKVQAMSTTHSIRSMRRNYWWEKFFWFVSSENYIVVGGRDLQQNEQLIKTHLAPGDVYVHADVEGACCVVVKNPHATRPVPPLTLAQAGSML